MPTPLSLEQRILIAAEYNADRVEVIKELIEEEVIKFEQWKLINGYYTPMGGRQYGQYFNLKGEGIANDAKQLYELYLQSNKHDNNYN